jgi:hypothetical protein
MFGGTTAVAGIDIPFTSPLLLAIVACHVAFGLTCVVTGAIAMLSQKRQGRHPLFGTLYFWCLSGVFASMTVLSLAHWAEDGDLFVLGALSFSAALTGRFARRHRWPQWIRLHIVGMSLSYILLLTAFYVDNSKSLPLWKDLPPIAFWILPSLVGLPLLVWALLRHPLTRRRVIAKAPTDAET